MSWSNLTCDDCGGQTSGGPVLRNELRQRTAGPAHVGVRQHDKPATFRWPKSSIIPIHCPRRMASLFPCRPVQPLRRSHVRSASPGVKCRDHLTRVWRRVGWKIGWPGRRGGKARIAAIPDRCTSPLKALRADFRYIPDPNLGRRIEDFHEPEQSSAMRLRRVAG